MPGRCTDCYHTSTTVPGLAVGWWPQKLRCGPGRGGGRGRGLDSETVQLLCAALCLRPAAAPPSQGGASPGARPGGHRAQECHTSGQLSSTLVTVVPTVNTVNTVNSRDSSAKAKVCEDCLQCACLFSEPLSGYSNQFGRVSESGPCICLQVPDSQSLT